MTRLLKYIQTYTIFFKIIAIMPLLCNYFRNCDAPPIIKPKLLKLIPLAGAVRQTTFSIGPTDSKASAITSRGTVHSSLAAFLFLFCSDKMLHKWSILTDNAATVLPFG